MVKELDSRITNIKRAKAIGSAIVLVGAASLGLSAEASAFNLTQNVSDHQQPETVPVIVPPAIIIPSSELQNPSRIVNRTLYDSRVGLSPEKPKPQTKGVLQGSSFSSRGVIFRK